MGAITAPRATPSTGELRAVARLRSEEGSRDRPLWYDLILAAITAFAGAGAAAWIVFARQVRKERREQREEEIRQLRRVAFALADRALILRELWTQWLEPARAFKGFWAPLQSPAGRVPPEPLSLERVAFLLESDDPNLLGSLHLAERKFQSFLETVNQYSKKRDEASTRIEERTQGADEPGVFSGEEVRKLAGPRLHHELKALAASLYARESLGDELMKLVDEVGDHVVKKYGGKRLRAEIPGARPSRPAEGQE